MPRPRWLLPVLVVTFALAADQGSKAWARSALVEGVPVPVIDGFWDWELAMNPGAAFSMFDDGSARVVLTLIGLAAVVAFGWMIARVEREHGAEARVRSTERERWALALLAAGAAGNLIDRISAGVVTDFVRWRWHDHRWPIFNVADAALLIGVAVLLVDGWRRRGGKVAG